MQSSSYTRMTMSATVALLIITIYMLPIVVIGVFNENDSYLWNLPLVVLSLINFILICVQRFALVIVFKNKAPRHPEVGNRANRILRYLCDNDNVNRLINIIQVMIILLVLINVGIYLIESQAVLTAFSRFGLVDAYILVFSLMLNLLLVFLRQKHYYNKLSVFVHFICICLIGFVVRNYLFLGLLWWTNYVMMHVTERDEKEL